MKKSLMSNIKNFVDSNVRQRIDKAAHNNSEFFDDDLLLIERQFEDLRRVCLEAEKKFSAMLLSLSSSSTNSNHVLSTLASASATNPSSSSSASTLLLSQSSQTATPATSDISNQSRNLHSNHHGAISDPASSIMGSTTMSNSSGIIATKQNQHLSLDKNPASSKLALAQATNKMSQLVIGTGSSSNNINRAANNQSDQTKDTLVAYINDENIKRYKKLPIVGFLKFLIKSRLKLKQDSLLATTLTHCSHIQVQLTKLYLNFEQIIESQCLKPIQRILEIDVPNVVKLRKIFIKSHNDLEALKTKYTGLSLKQNQLLQQHHHHQSLQSGHFTTAAAAAAAAVAQSLTQSSTSQSQQQANITKLDQLKKELEDAIGRYEQARDTYATELYAFVCRETELVNLFIKFYVHLESYQQQVASAIQGSLPPLNNILAKTHRKIVFGTSLEEHVRCTGRPISLVVEICVHLLYLNALSEEGLFRVPGSSAKIKKLKNAINAWFITVAGQVGFGPTAAGSDTDLSSTQNQDSNHPSATTNLTAPERSMNPPAHLIAIYNLIRDITSQSTQSDSIYTSAAALSTPSSTCDQLAPDEQHPTTMDAECSLVYDVHTIAGLLKLYLRELPEPLFTFSLYQRWIEATVRGLNNPSDLILSLEKVVQLLPKANYDNLSHLIRFLHLLTSHKQSNKMNASNLSITMAPSLIWPKHEIIDPGTLNSPSMVGSGEDLTLEQMSQLQAQRQQQISNVGISTSLHALVIENLIKNAEQLFPEPIKFHIPTLYNSNSLNLSRKQLARRHQQLPRASKSTSPTGLSTASSSSFSSGSSSAHSAELKSAPLAMPEPACAYDKNSSRGIADSDSIKDNPTSCDDLANNASLVIRAPPPPVPPAPKTRSHLVRQATVVACDNQTPAITTRTAINTPTANPRSYKQPAPPVPTQKQHKLDVRDSTTSAPFPRSTRGTGSVPLQSAAGSVTRPNVPPPVVPTQSSSQVAPSSQSKANQNSKHLHEGANSSSKNSRGGGGADFEDIIPGEGLDEFLDIANGPGSTVVSLDSGSLSAVEDDSSFESGEDRILGNSWTECSFDQDQSITVDPISIEAVNSESGQVSSERCLSSQSDKVSATNSSISLEKNIVPSESTGAPHPVRPPRSTSPKLAQSTPL